MAATRSRRARWFVTAGVLFLVAWQVADLLGVGRGTGVALALYGFVLHVIFGKAYSLVSSYFDRELGLTWAPALQFPLTAGGATCLALAPFGGGFPALEPVSLAAVGATAWLAGVVVFVGAMAWTIRDNPTGAETATGDHNEERRDLDRLANAGVPVVLGYLLLGSLETAGRYWPVPAPLGGYPPRATHLLAAGVGVLLLISVGFRLLPRFLVAKPPRFTARVALPAGAVGPIALAVTLPGGHWFGVAAAVEAVAVVAYSVAVLGTVYRSDRDRVGFYGVILGAVAGVAGVGLGAWFAVDGPRAPVVAAHLLANLGGFLGVTIVGVAYQFYPPAAGTFPGASDRTALASILALWCGIGVRVVALLVGLPRLELVGAGLSTLGAVLFAVLVLGLFAERYWTA